MRRVPPHLTANTRTLRSGQTETERRIGLRISRYRPRFTRQLVVGPYIVDLAYRSARLAVEFNGSQHIETKAYDDRRSIFLIENGWTVIRFWNNEVMENPDGVVQAILSKTAECLGGTHPQPLPSREGRRRE